MKKYSFIKSYLLTQNRVTGGFQGCPFQILTPFMIQNSSWGVKLTHLGVVSGKKVLFYKKLLIDSKPDIRGFSSMLFSNIDTYYDSKFIWGGKIDLFGGCKV